jgi:hypothetical protein
MRHQVFQHCLRRRHHERARAAKDHQDREHGPDDGAAAPREQQQQGAGEQLGAEAPDNDVAPIMGVGDMAGPEDQDQERRELRQPDQAQRKQAVRHLVDLPANCDALHLHRQGAEDTGREVQRQVTVAQDGKAAGRRLH